MIRRQKNQVSKVVFNGLKITHNKREIRKKEVRLFSVFQAGSPLDCKFLKAS